MVHARRNSPPLPIPEAKMEGKKLTRSDNRMIAGVCAGIAEYLGWSVGLTRLLFVLVSVLSVAFPGILVYLVLWIMMPTRR